MLLNLLFIVEQFSTDYFKTPTINFLVISVTNHNKHKQVNKPMQINVNKTDAQKYLLAAHNNIGLGLISVNT